MGNLLELLVDLWQVLLQATHLRGCANARYPVLALSIEQVFTIEFLLACARITGESHACAAVIAHIAKDHALDVNSCFFLMMRRPPRSTLFPSTTLFCL